MYKRQHLKYLDLIVLEAFEKYLLRIPRQLAFAITPSLEKALATFDGVFGENNWRDGDTNRIRNASCITIQHLQLYADCVGASLYVYEGRRLVCFQQDGSQDRERPDRAAIVLTVGCGLTVFRRGSGLFAEEDGKTFRPDTPRARAGRAGLPADQVAGRGSSHCDSRLAAWK